jgi:recombinational DNA repair protein RecR
MSEHCINCGKLIVSEMCECLSDEEGDSIIIEVPDYSTSLERIAVALENLLYEIRELRVRR